MPGDQGSAIRVQAWLFPATQAILTATSTLAGVYLVTKWRSDRSHWLPFYSDATHHDPERIILSLGENLACFCVPFTASAEFLQHRRLIPLYSSTVTLHHHNITYKLSTSLLVNTLAITQLLTCTCFFLTANIPSRWPYTPFHQAPASALIALYATQATLKALLAVHFRNYKSPSSATLIKEQQSTCWHRVHTRLRIAIAVALWATLFATWIIFMYITIIRRVPGRNTLRKSLNTALAAVVHVATINCIALMTVSAIDLRNETVCVATSLREECER